MVGFMALKLNIGAGSTEIEGFTPIDRKLGTEAYPLAYADNTVDEIRASHVLEHFTFRETQDVLREWVRVLKPGGRIRIAVPDFDKIDKSDRLWPFYVMGGQTDENDIHKSIFDESRLRSLMEASGLSGINRWHSDNTDTAAHKVSLNLEGVKAESVATAQDIKITAIMSIPRIGWNDAWGCVFSALKPFGIPLRTYSGAYWGHCLQTMLESAVDEGLDWVICLDYDTMFTAEHLDRLFGHLGQNPHIDAIAALQSRRGHETPLMTAKNDDGTKASGAVVDGTPLKAHTAHFGLTVIRLDALRDIPKPWIWEQCGPDGSWTHDDHIDPDIGFWKAWEAHGKTVYVAPDVRIGHLELMVSQFNERMEFEQLPVTAWRDLNYGKPE